MTRKRLPIGIQNLHKMRGQVIAGRARSAQGQDDAAEYRHRAPGMTALEIGAEFPKEQAPDLRLGVGLSPCISSR